MHDGIQCCCKKERTLTIHNSQVLSLGSEIIHVNMSCYFSFAQVYDLVPGDLGTKPLPCLLALCLGAQGRSRHPLGINKCLWIKSDRLNPWLRARTLGFPSTFFFKCPEKHMACSANAFVTWYSQSLLCWCLSSPVWPWETKSQWIE